MLGPRDNDGEVQPFRHSAKERAMARHLGVKRFVDGWLETYATGVARRVKEGTGSELNRSPIYGVGTTEYMRSVGGYRGHARMRTARGSLIGRGRLPRDPQLCSRSWASRRNRSPRRSAKYEALHLHEVIDPQARRTMRSRAPWSSFDQLKKGRGSSARATTARRSCAPHDGWIMFPGREGAAPGTSGSTSPEPLAAI
jgi:hypothetical protein